MPLHYLVKHTGVIVDVAGTFFDRLTVKQKLHWMWQRLTKLISSVHKLC